MIGFTLDLVRTVEHERQSQNLTIAVFSDIRFAFDTVRQTHVLLHALNQLNVRRLTVRWIKNFLYQRKIFIVTIKGKRNKHQQKHGDHKAMRKVLLYSLR